MTDVVIHQGNARLKPFQLAKEVFDYLRVNNGQGDGGLALAYILSPLDEPLLDVDTAYPGGTHTRIISAKHAAWQNEGNLLDLSKLCTEVSFDRRSRRTTVILALPLKEAKVVVAQFRQLFKGKTMAEPTTQTEAPKDSPPDGLHIGWLQKGPPKAAPKPVSAAPPKEPKADPTATNNDYFLEDRFALTRRR